MISINKYPLASFFSVGALPQHLELRQLLLDTVNLAQTNQLKQQDNYYTDSISKVDWDLARNFNRPWVKVLLPAIQEYLNFAAFSSGYQNAIIEEIWFQQYVNGDCHGWHTHGSNFTGVYYLELDAASPRTEIIEPGTQSVKVTPDVSEGHVLIFPSYTIHKAPNVTNDQRKTIISFNFVMNLINPKLLSHLNNTNTQ